MLEGHCTEVLGSRWGSSCILFLFWQAPVQVRFQVLLHYLWGPLRSIIFNSLVKKLKLVGFFISEEADHIGASWLGCRYFLPRIRYWLTSLVVVVMLVSGTGCPEELGHSWGGPGKDHANGWRGTTENGGKLYHTAGLKNAPWGRVILAVPLGGSKPPPFLFEPVWERWGASSLASCWNITAFFKLPIAA